MGKLVILINKFLSKLNILKKRVDYIGGNDKKGRRRRFSRKVIY